MTDNELLVLAHRARENSYSPYSHFSVGAALLCKSGKKNNALTKPHDIKNQTRQVADSRRQNPRGFH